MPNIDTREVLMRELDSAIEGADNGTMKASAVKVLDSIKDLPLGLRISALITAFALTAAESNVARTLTVFALETGIKSLLAKIARDLPPVLAGVIYASSAKRIFGHVGRVAMIDPPADNENVGHA